MLFSAETPEMFAIYAETRMHLWNPIFAETPGMASLQEKFILNQVH
jgi:hypothetical protein